METAQLNLADRWYLGYDLDEPLPDHSSLSKIRSRYGLEAFHGFFERIVELCVEVALVEGEELCLDATEVDANASLHTLRTRFSVAAAREHVEKVFAGNPGPDEPVQAHPSLRRPSSSIAPAATGSEPSGSSTAVLWTRWLTKAAFFNSLVDCAMPKVPDNECYLHHDFCVF